VAALAADEDVDCDVDCNISGIALHSERRRRGKDNEQGKERGEHARSIACFLGKRSAIAPVCRASHVARLSLHLALLASLALQSVQAIRTTEEGA
jgi:hypothetical protein